MFIKCLRGISADRGKNQLDEIVETFFLEVGYRDTGDDIVSSVVITSRRGSAGDNNKLRKVSTCF